MTPRLTRFPRLLRLALQFAAALMLALLLAEGLVRAAGLRPPPRMTPEEGQLLRKVPEELVPGLGHTLNPGARGRVVYPGRDGAPDREVLYLINDSGFRDEPFRLRSPGVDYRVAVMGDSIAYGTGIPLEQTLAHQLRPLLAARFPEAAIEVFNCGVPATNTAQQAALLPRVLKLEPDLVLLVSTIVDASGHGIRGNLSERARSVGWLDRLGLTSGVFDSPELSTAARRTMAVRRASALADLMAFQLYRHLHADTLVANYRACWAEGAPGLASVRTALAAMRELSAAAGARLHVAMYPFLAGLDGDYPFAAEAARMQASCEALGLPFTHLLPAFDGRRPIDLQAHAHDRHPNGYANGLAAAALADALAPGIAADLAERSSR